MLTALSICTVPAPAKEATYTTSDHTANSTISNCELQRLRHTINTKYTKSAESSNATIARCISIQYIDLLVVRLAQTVASRLDFDLDRIDNSVRVFS